MSTINLRIGQGYEIHLKSNPTTGYSWDYSLTDDVISADEVYQGSPSNGRVGVGGETIVYGRALRRGTTIMHLWYAQQWDTTTSPAETHTYTFNVV